MVLDIGQKPDAEDEAILRLIEGMDNLYIFNKSDLPEHPGFSDWLQGQHIPKDETMTLSAQLGIGLDALRARLARQRQPRAKRPDAGAAYEIGQAGGGGLKRARRRCRTACRLTCAR